MPLASRRVFCRPFVIGAVAVLTLAPVAAAPDSKSAASAKELTQLLDAAKLDGMATADPAAPGTFIAALYIPGAQLLVISAKYTAPALLVDKINAGDFRGVYMDLHSASVRESRIFVQDQGADGLMSRPDGGDAADSWDDADKPHTLDGAKKEKMSDAEYTKMYADGDERYAKMLSLLIAQTKQIKPKSH